MNIDELIRNLLALVNSCSGSFYTSTHLRHNPDVCHAACIWFLSNMPKIGLRAAVTQLDSMDKSTLKKAQEYVMNAPKTPRLMLEKAMGSGKGVSDKDIEAIDFMINYWGQPNVYSENIHEVVMSIARAMRSTADRLVVYMRPGMGGAGHVICLARNVGGIVIYDPNIGVMTFQLSNVDAWRGVLATILNWYSLEMKLTFFGYR